MPRLARLDMPGLLQHVIVRGVEKRDIFHDERDKRQFLDRFSDLLIETETLCYAWSLITNHFHLLLQPTRFKLSLIMRRLLTGYAVTFNLRHDRVGHLFQNRYKSIVCDKEVYMLELVRYIHLNPVRAGLVDTLEGLDRYPWSGHAVLMGNRRLDGQVVDEILQRFDQSVSRARVGYHRFVSEGLTMGRREDLVGSGFKGKRLAGENKEKCDDKDSRILGDKVFADSILRNRSLYERARISLPLPELVNRVSSLLSVDPHSIRRPSKARPLADARSVVCYLAIRELGYKGLELGRELNLGAAGVSIAVRRGESLLRDKPEFKEEILFELAK